MKKYRVRYSAEALTDLLASYEWGISNWGLGKADEWFDHIDNMIRTNLSTLPLACSLAPENIHLKYETRQLLIGRYRVLFHMKAEEVLVVHITGPFTPQK